MGLPIRSFIFRALGALAIAGAPVMVVSEEDLAQTRQILAQEGISVTQGAAPGYVPDQICADCHADKAESFAEMGMARSFYRPTPDKVIEDFSAPAFHHAPSGRHYRMEQRGDAYWFHRHRLAPDGREVDQYSVKVDWILGSGNHARVYLYQTPDGALHQLPLGWYTQDRKWAMAPGFEFADHGGVLREVSPRCMGCHNTFADYPRDSDRHGMPWVYPADMPEGIGCQRCHGPGAQHVRYALTGEVELDDLRATIVQPGKLDQDRLYSICYGCHMQPTVAINGQLRLGRGHYSFRPGQDLGDFLVQLDIEDAHRTKPERFDINHHPYRLEQSSCFIESQGALGCLTCHDPHVRIKPEERAAHYRKACLSCHETDDAGLPVMAETAHPQIGADEDCTACHMPNRRTQDVVEVWMTDHRIVRNPGPGDLLAPQEKVPAEVLQVYLANPDADLPEDEALILRIIATLQHTGHQAGYAADALAQVLRESGSSDHAPWTHLLRAYVAQNRFVEAERIAAHTLSLDPGNPMSVQQAAVAYFRTGQQQWAITLLQDLLAQAPAVANAHYTLATIQYSTGDVAAARRGVEAALELRPNHWRAQVLLGRIKVQDGDMEAGLAHLSQAVAIAPDAHIARRDLISVLETLGRADEAARQQALLP